MKWKLWSYQLLYMSTQNSEVTQLLLVRCLTRAKKPNHRCLSGAKTPTKRHAFIWNIVWCKVWVGVTPDVRVTPDAHRAKTNVGSQRLMLTLLATNTKLAIVCIDWSFQCYSDFVSVRCYPHVRSYPHLPKGFSRSGDLWWLYRSTE